MALDTGVDAVPPATGWKLLGWLGVVPFVALAVAVRTLDEAASLIARDLLLGYGALILSFIGGSWWARALDPAADHGRRLATLAMLPTLAGWAALMIGDTAGLLLLATALVAALAADGRGILVVADPGAYLRLRFGLTATAVLSLLAAVPFG
jgi:hypothetical protein